MWQSIKKLDKWLDTHWVFLLFLPIVLVLRVPGFSEPYWYGDEGIYLAIGNALNHGQRLYADIVDHKTPLIYYFAQVPSQVTFRVLLTVWMLSATGFFYSTLRSLTKTRVAAIVGLSLFTLCTTLPALEGNIPNGELFVIGFVLAGGAVLFKQPITARLMSGARSSLPTIQTIPFWPTLIAGVGTGLGLLVKVPALFDAAALTSVFYFIALKTLRPTTWKQQWTTLLSFALKHWLVFAAGFFLPLSVSILYFWSIGAGSEYLEFGLLYNFHYSSNWGLGIENPLLAWLFTLPGKACVLLGSVACISLFSSKLKPSFLFALTWVCLALFAALLSNRPYPHYLLQVVPPAALLVALYTDDLVGFVKKTVPLGVILREKLLAVVFFSVLAGVFLTLNFYTYPSWDYYHNWYQYATNSISRHEYYQRFNPIMSDNYQVAEIISSDDEVELFIWGTNPMLYPLSGSIPTGRFTVAFHIADLNAFDETLRDLIIDEPTYIVVMKGEQTPFPDFFTYLQRYYRPYQEFAYFTLYKKGVIQLY